MKTIACFLLTACVAVAPAYAVLGLLLLPTVQVAFADNISSVTMQRVPSGGIQPQLAVGEDGVVHLIYFKGDASAGDIFYCRADNPSSLFSEPIRVNSQPASAIATGTIRGAHLAIGKESRVHVAWNGSGKATPKGLPNPDLPKDSPYRLSSPMLYTRMNDDGDRFEAQRNLMTHTYSLDGGGSLAADSKGNVFVIWHANSQNDRNSGEAGRAVWVAVSRDDGATFATEARANADDTGACGCCGLRAYVAPNGLLYVLYRTAEGLINRDMHLLASNDQARSFSSTKLDPWEVPTCVMSSAALLGVPGKTFAAWETEQQVKFARVDNVRHLSQPAMITPPTSKDPCKHPVLAVNPAGYTILVWTEGTGWNKGGSLAWQLFDPSGDALPEHTGRVDGVPVWSFAGVFARLDGNFTIVY